MKATRQAVTLMELVVVLIILIALASIVMPLLTTSTGDAKNTVTLANMQTVKNAIAAYTLDMKGIAVSIQGYPDNVAKAGFTAAEGNTTGLPLTLKDLIVAPKDVNGNTIGFDPLTRRGWRGPYLSGLTGPVTGLTLDGSFTRYMQATDPAVLDGWSRPIVIQWVSSDPAGKWMRLVSAGQGGVLEAPEATTNLTGINLNDDFVVYINQPLSFAPK